MRIELHKGDEDGMKLELSDKVFTGRALYRDTTILGLAVSVLVDNIPDRHSTFVTLVVPEAYCPENRRSIKVSTFEVRTTKVTTIAGPEGVGGQVDRYEVVPLEGNAW